MDEITNIPLPQLNGGLSGLDKGQNTTKGPSFGDILQSAIRESADTVRAGEQASARAVTGEANLQDVVGAITQAELTLETVVAVRDRLVTAYQELMRMPV